MANLPSDFEASDAWSRWLLRERDAGDPVQRQRNLVEIHRFRDRVLEGARLFPRVRFLDIGAGEGLLGLGALARLGPAIHVTFNDISAALLERLRQPLAAAGLAEQCSFVHGSAEQLPGIDANTLDVVAARSALAYVPDKAAAFAACYQVLRPGGRLSIADPRGEGQAWALAKACGRRQPCGSSEAVSRMRRRASAVSVGHRSIRRASSVSNAPECAPDSGNPRNPPLFGPDSSPLGANRRLRTRTHVVVFEPFYWAVLRLRASRRGRLLVRLLPRMVRSQVRLLFG